MSDTGEPTRSFRPLCAEHGELDTFEGRGYSLGHRTGRDGPNERDLEGITFVFERVEDGESEFCVGASESGRYLSKFADWREKMLDVVVGRADSEDLACPECGRPVLVLGAGEEVPDWFEEYREMDDPPR